MRIIEINIIQFGKFTDKAFTLHEGLNIIKGDNESGKSTLLAFIKFALYGVGRKNPSVAVGERERALSWSTGVAAGSLTVEDVDGKQYRIERNGREGARGAYSDKVKIIDLENGEEVFAGEIPGEHFLGINAQAYDSMCNIKQLEAVAVGGDAVKGVIDNLLSSGDENLSINSAVKALESERRRLLHTNGKGGLVYESEATLERLKSEHRGAIISENEKIKNHDELERVELALSKARAEFDVAQRMCDVHDDVLRLQKFDELASVKKQSDILLERSNELDINAGFDTSLASYGLVAKIKNAAEMLDGSIHSVEIAKKELDEAEEALSKVLTDYRAGFDEIMDEFHDPDAALTHLSVKKKKKASSALLLTVFGVACALLFTFAAVIAFVMQNIAGAATVAFIGALIFAAAFAHYKKYSRAKAEIGSFMQKMGDGFCSKNEEKIRSALDEFYKSTSERTRLSNAKESARFRFNVSSDAYNSNLLSARNIANELKITCADGDIVNELSGVAALMSEYLIKKTALEGEIRENQAVLKSISHELERFSERDIRARITPEIKEKINGVSFERLKADRDSALYKTNQFNQYKASLERNLATVGGKRSSADIFPEIEAEKEQLASLKLRLDAVRLALDTINEASLALKSDVTPRIRSVAQRNLSDLTDGRYAELYIDDDMGLSVFAQGETRPIDSLSKGSLDSAYFAVRLALIQTLLADKQPPLYMDETLSQLDDKRATNALRVISEYSKKAQCILFTCQSRDVALSRDITDFNLVEI